MQRADQVLANPVAPGVLAAPSFTVGGVIAKTFSTWARNLVPFALLMAISQLPPYVVDLLVDHAIYGTWNPTMAQVLAQPDDSRALAAAVQMIVVSVLLAFVRVGALSHGAIQHLAGKKVSTGALLEVALRRAWPAVVAGALFAFTVLVGTVALVVPGVIVLAALAVAIPVAVVERKGGPASTSRSFELTRGKLLAILGCFAVMGLVACVVTAVTAMLPDVLGGSLAAGIFGFAVYAAMAPLWELLPGVLYSVLRATKDGLDPASLARVFE